MVQTKKKIALLHRYPADQIKQTNAAFPYLVEKGIDVLTFKKFDRLSKYKKFWKSLLWIFYAPCLVFGRGYDVIYCDDSYPFYPALVKMASPKSKVVIRIGDLHLMYYYSGWVYKFLHFFEKITWRIVDKTIPISREMAWHVFLGAGNKWLDHEILDPVDPKDFPVQEPRGIDAVMFHGVLTKNKNLDLVIEAAKRLPNVTFVVAGDGPEYARIFKIAPDNVYLPGWCNTLEIATLMGACSVGLALRSNNPGNEYVVTSPFLQYGVMGKPCLVTRRRVFGDYAWQFSNVDEMVSKLEFLLKHPEEGEKLREYILKNHNAKDKAEEIWNLLSA